MACSTQDQSHAAHEQHEPPQLHIMGVLAVSQAAAAATEGEHLDR